MMRSAAICISGEFLSETKLIFPFSMPMQPPEITGSASFIVMMFAFLIKISNIIQFKPTKPTHSRKCFGRAGMEQMFG